MLLSVVDLALHDQMNGRVSWDSRRPTGSRGASPCFDHTINNRVTEVGRLCGAGGPIGRLEEPAEVCTGERPHTGPRRPCYHFPMQT
jgi:hypothetical protein